MNIETDLVKEQAESLMPGQNTEKTEIMICIETIPRLNDQVGEAINALVKYNEPPTLFKSSGGICSVDEIAPGEYIISMMAEGRLRAKLSGASRWVKLREAKDGDIYMADIYPPIPVVKAIISDSTVPFPWLNGITNTPIIRSDGSISDVKGFDESTGYYYAPNDDFELPEIPANPTREDAQRAARYIMEELFSDFPFVDNASSSNALAALITPLARPMIEGCVPLGLVNKPSPGTGASLLINVISFVANGRDADLQKDPRSEEEWQKTLHSSLLKGSLIVCFDNVDSDLSSSALASVLTAQSVEGRVLGKSEIRTVKNRACWYVTGNNLQVAGDLGRRSYLIQMDARSARAWERDPAYFRHQDLRSWIRNNRGRLVAAVFTMIRAWTLAGKPKPSCKPMGSFEEWSYSIGGILEYSGVQGFRENDDLLQNRIDIGSEKLELFMDSWFTVFGDKEVTAKQIAEWVKSGDVVAPDEIAEAASVRTSAISIGKKLEKLDGRISQNGFVLRRRHDRASSKMVYKVERIGSN